MMRLWVLFPQEYAKELEPERALGSIEEAAAEAFGQEATLLGWQVLDGPAPGQLLPEMVMSLVKSAAEKGIDPLQSQQSVTYATVECPPEVVVGMCVFSDKPVKKRRRLWRR
jgi:hypothetical protein